MKNKVLVLLSTYNGEKYLETQLDSLLKQKEVSLNILIRDDGSKDSTKEIIRNYMKEHKNISFFEGNNIGYAKSFWELIKKAEEYDYYAFCDQDDIWLENKLIKAISKIEHESSSSIPTLYTSKVVSVDNSLNIINDNTFPTNRVINVYESFQRSVAPGCTFVFNNSAKNIIKKYDGYMESHDWAAYAIINVFGKVLYDNNSYINYRIHGNNAIGQNNIFHIYCKKIKNFFKKSPKVRSKFAKDFIKCYHKKIPKSIYNDIYLLANYDLSYKNKLNLLFNNKFKGLFFKIYIILNRI